MDDELSAAAAAGAVVRRSRLMYENSTEGIRIHTVAPLDGPLVYRIVSAVAHQAVGSSRPFP